MPRILDQEMNWEELCEYTIKQLGNGLKPKETIMFRKWFIEREVVGKLFDPILTLRCFRIWKELNDNLDHFVVICGREGFGKTTLSFQIAAWVNPNFDLTNVCYGAKHYLDILSKKANSFHQELNSETVVLDEGTELLSRETLNATNRVLTKTFFVQRSLKFLVIVNIPNFFMLDGVIRNHRVRTLIEVIGRGKYKCITGKGINIVADKGMRTKDIGCVRIPNGSFWHGSFRVNFPKKIDRKEYEKYKLQSIKDLIEEMKDDVVSKKLLSTAKVAKQIDLSSGTMISMIKRGELEGKQVASKWYLTRKGYDKVMQV